MMTSTHLPVSGDVRCVLEDAVPPGPAGQCLGEVVRDALVERAHRGGDSAQVTLQRTDAILEARQHVHEGWGAIGD